MPCQNSMSPNHPIPLGDYFPAWTSTPGLESGSGSGSSPFHSVSYQMTFTYDPDSAKNKQYPYADSTIPYV